MTTEKKVKTATNKFAKRVGQFFAGAAGVVGGTMLLKQIPGHWAIPGSVGLLTASGIMGYSKNVYVTALGIGVGGASALNLVKNGTEGKTGVLAKVNQAVTLSGPRGVGALRKPMGQVTDAQRAGAMLLNGMNRPGLRMPANEMSMSQAAMLLN